MKQKAGPLPVWAWALIAAGAAFYLWRRHRRTGSSSPATAVTQPSSGIQPLMGPTAPSVVSTPSANGVGSTTLPGSSVQQVASRGSSYNPQKITINGQEYMGQLTEGGKGETEYFSEPGQLVGGGTFVKPGHYTRLKMPATVPGGGQNTIWIYAGD